MKLTIKRCVDILKLSKTIIQDIYNRKDNNLCGRRVIIQDCEIDSMWSCGRKTQVLNKSFIKHNASH